VICTVPAGSIGTKPRDVFGIFEAIWVFEVTVQTMVGTSFDVEMKEVQGRQGQKQPHTRKLK
jgi:hypothetical protein